MNTVNEKSDFSTYQEDDIKPSFIDKWIHPSKIITFYTEILPIQIYIFFKKLIFF